MPITAIFGGTFNPFHIGHYQMLKALHKCEKIGKIFIMPDKIPPHKSCDFLANDDVRIEMCRIAASDFSKAEVCLIEFEREGKSYTYDTLKLLKEKYPNENFAFVCGGDMLVNFDKWYNYEYLMKNLPFIVFKRTDTDEQQFEYSIERFSKMGMNITVMDKKIATVSSTEIRAGFSEAEKLLPERIYNFLLEKDIYVD